MREKKNTTHINWTNDIINQKNLFILLAVARNFVYPSPEQHKMKAASRETDMKNYLKFVRLSTTSVVFECISFFFLQSNVKLSIKLLVLFYLFYVSILTYKVRARTSVLFFQNKFSFRFLKICCFFIVIVQLFLFFVIAFHS